METSILFYLEGQTFKSSFARDLAGTLIKNLTSRGAKSRLTRIRIYEKLHQGVICYCLTQEESRYLIDSSHNDPKAAPRVFEEMRERLPEPVVVDKSIFNQRRDLVDFSYVIVYSRTDRL